MKDKTNEELIKTYVGGDKSAFNALHSRFEAYMKHVARTYYLMGEERDDVLQYAEIGFFYAVMNYDGDEPFEPYAKACIKNRVLDEIKKKNADKRKPVVFDAIYATFVDPQQNVVDKDMAERVMKFIDEKCSEAEREAIKMFVDGKSYKEIATETGKEEKAVDNAVQRVRNKVKAEFGG